jgi:hypothetical protein
MAEFKYDILFASTATGTGASDASAGIRNVEAAATRATVTQSQMSMAGNAASASSDKLGRLATQAGYQISDFAVQVQSGQSAVTAFSQQFPQLIGAFQQSGISAKELGANILQTSVGVGTAMGIIATAVGIGAQLVIKEYQAMTKAQNAAKESANQLAKQNEYLATARAKVLDMAREEAINRFYKEQETALNNQAAAMERISKVRGAESQTDTMAAESALAAAQAGGGNVTAARANLIETEFSGEMARLAEEFQNFEFAVTRAEEKVSETTTKMADAQRIYGQYADESKKATAEWEKATNELDQAGKDLESQRQIMGERAAQLAIQTADKIAAAQAEADAQAAKAATDALAKMSTGNAQMQNYMAEIAKAAESGGKITTDELPKVQDAFARLVGGMQSGLVAVDGNVTEMIGLVRTLTASQSAANSEISQLRRDVNRMMSRSTTPTSSP